jgi:hypothetical protein
MILEGARGSPARRGPDHHESGREPIGIGDLLADPALQRKDRPAARVAAGSTRAGIRRWWRNVAAHNAALLGAGLATDQREYVEGYTGPLGQRKTMARGLCRTVPSAPTEGRSHMAQPRLHSHIWAVLSLLTGPVLLACGSSSSAAGAGAPPSTDGGGQGSDASRTSDGAAGSSGGDGGSVDGGALPTFTTDYTAPGSWLCGAIADHDYCLDPQTAKEIKADGSQADAPMPAATSTKVDCFYVYPTVAISAPVGNKNAFDNIPDILDPLMAQAAPFNQVCTVFAPLYHQITIASYSDPNRDRYLEIAYTDVAAAFRYYLDHLSHGRKFVLMGHSQGTHMIRRLIQREVETKPDVLSRMLLAVGAGALGDIVVPKGAKVGGSFRTVPLCTGPAQTGCMMTFNTYATAHPPLGSAFNASSTMEAACTNPAALGGGKARFTGSLFPTRVHQALLDPKIDFGVTSTFAQYGDFFTGECKADPSGNGYLEVTGAPASGDVRVDPIPYDASLFSANPPLALGLHLLDFSFPMQELIGAVRTRASAL